VLLRYDTSGTGWHGISQALKGILAPPPDTRAERREEKENQNPGTLSKFRDKGQSQLVTQRLLSPNSR